MMVMMKIHRRLELTVAVLILIVFSSNNNNNCVISQPQSGEVFEISGSEGRQLQQQQQQLQLVQSNTTAGVVAATTTKVDSTAQQQSADPAAEAAKLVLAGASATLTATTATAATTTTIKNATTVEPTARSTSSSSSSSTASLSSSASSSSSSSAAAVSASSASSSAFASAASAAAHTQRHSPGSGEISSSETTGESDETVGSAEILSVAEDAADRSNFAPTTYRPARPAIAPHTSAQERERKLMNVLAARRSALHRGNFRTRIGTTGRTATASAIETTSKAPTDPRSICIRNCTKNFTRRTTASCMRQCANFSRSTLAASTANASSVIVKPSSKTGLGTQSGDRDTNEILFTDESSHGLFVVAKDQNDTLNHIPSTIKGGGKFRTRGKSPQPVTVTLAPSSVEEDEIQPYLFFGQKLPPIKPAMLTITSVSDDHPKLLEVSVAQLASTASAPLTSTSTLSPVERSRSRYKYRDRGYVTFNRRVPPNRAGASLWAEAPAEPKVGALLSVAETTAQPKELSSTVPSALRSRGKTTVVSSTPLIITVLSDEEELPAPSPVPLVQALREEPSSTDATTTAKTTTTTPATTTATTTTRRASSTIAAPTSTSTSTAATTTTATASIARTTAKATTTSTTTTTTTTTTALPTTRRTSTTTTTTTSTTPPSPSTTTSTTSTTTTTAKPSIAAPRKSIIEEDTERLRALGPSLTQEISTDEKTNLIIFINRTSSTATSRRPPYNHRADANAAHPLPPTTDSPLSILRTTVLSSVRSTVHPRTSTPAYVGVIESAPAEVPPSQQAAGNGNGNGGAVSSTAVADEGEVSLEMRRMNLATMVLAGIGVFPLCALILYLVRNFLLRRHAKDEEDFDVCITDQQPISPVKKLDSKYRPDDDDADEVDNHQQHQHQQQQLQAQAHKQHFTPQQQRKMATTRDANHNDRYDEQCSVTSDQEFDRGNIRLKSLLGEGNFGQVWKAEADDLSGHFGATRIVAVKTIRACSAQASLKDEAHIMRKLGSHPNVVTLLGACVESEPHMLIMEYAMRGRLLSLLRAARSATNILPASVPGGRSLAPLSPRTLAGFALDIACGMEYIAGKRIVHRDLAARNVLLDHNGVCKICDFGMSLDLDAERKRKEQEKNCANDIMRSNSNKFKLDFAGRFIMNHWNSNFGGQHESGAPSKDTHSEKKSHGHGHGHDTIGRRPALPIRWMAPEALQYHIFTTETDVWAFGIVLWEIATLGSTPYSQLTGREVIRRVPHGLRPELPKEGRHEFYNLMSRCWHKDPHMRPSFAQARLEVSRSLHKWVDDDSAASDYMDVSGFSEDLEHGMVYFNHRISEFECEI